MYKCGLGHLEPSGGRVETQMQKVQRGSWSATIRAMECEGTQSHKDREDDPQKKTDTKRTDKQRILQKKRR